MFRCVTWILAMLSAVLASPLVVDESSKISYRGSLSDDVEHFQNIKYAHDTSGARRFAPPEIYLPAAGSEIDATARGPACPQLQGPLPPFFSPEPVISEDCLNLRISRPAGLNFTSQSRMPVLVWLHGGGVVKGSAYDDHSDPDKLLRLSKLNGQPVIYAAINFRLTVFGFAHSTSLKAAKADNVGMRDQRAGLQWLKDHVAAFGGDPNRITAFGLSAGGTFTSLQHVAFGGEHGVPFDRAFMMSGPTGTAVNQLDGKGIEHTRNLAGRLECKVENDRGMIDCLRAVPMQRLLEGAMNYSIENNPPNGLFTFIPEVDGDILPDLPSKLLHGGRFATGIPSILAWTEDDGALNAGPAQMYRTEEDMLKPLKIFFRSLKDEHHKRLFELYPASDFTADARAYNAVRPSDAPEVPVHWYRISRMLRDILFTCSSLDFTHQMLKHSRLQGDESFRDVYVYSLNQSVLNPIWKSIGFPYVGVSHGSDQHYVFNGVYPEGKMTKSDRTLASELSSSIINFAYTGNPVSDDRFSQTFNSWPPVCATYNKDGNALPDLTLQLLGGPHGTVSVAVGHDTAEVLEMQADTHSGQGLQSVLGGVLGYGPMMSRSEDAATLLTKQRLHERCNYIIGLGEWLQT